MLGCKPCATDSKKRGKQSFYPDSCFSSASWRPVSETPGETTLALETVDQALSRCERRDEGWYIAELLRIKGQLFLVRPNRGAAAQAEKLFLSSLDRAGQQGALSWELRTATSLARLWKERRRLTEARSLLMPIYARFTEGFATADLRSAKTLLEELDEPGYPPP